MELSPEFVEENFFMPRLMRLFDAVSTEIEAAKGPKLAHKTLWVGTEQPPFGIMSGEECGVMWVQPGAVSLTTSFPTPNDGELATCSAMPMMEVTIGVARCLPRADLRDTHVDAQHMFAATKLYLGDMAAVRRAAVCMFPQELPTGELYQASLGTWTPIEDQAGVSGGTWQVWIG